MASDPSERIDRNTVEARQGSTRPRVIYVLAAAVVLVIVAFAAVAILTHH